MNGGTTRQENMNNLMVSFYFFSLISLDLMFVMPLRNPPDAKPFPAISITVHGFYLAGRNHLLESC